MTAPSTPRESRQRVSDALDWTLWRVRPDRLKVLREWAKSVTGWAKASGQEFAGVLDDLDDTRAALAEAKARIAELERERDYIEDRRRYWHHEACKENARADAAEARIATVRAEALEEVSSFASKEAQYYHGLSAKGPWEEGMHDMAVRFMRAIRDLIPAGTSSCATKDEEANFPKVNSVGVRGAREVARRELTDPHYKRGLP